jgi:ribosomal protein S18 acetylase RimI-like enzyme
MKYAFEMEYVRPVDEKSAVSLVPYSSEYREQYKKIYNACYHEMREALDIKPYDFIQDDSFFDEGMDKVYLLLDNGVIIGSVALLDDELDDLIVNPEYQGKGYGKQILLWALENINLDRIVLHVAEWNQRAINLYKKTGFEITETIEIG